MSKLEVLINTRGGGGRIEEWTKQRHEVDNNKNIVNLFP